MTNYINCFNKWIRKSMCLIHLWFSVAEDKLSIELLDYELSISAKSREIEKENTSLTKLVVKLNDFFKRQISITIYY